MPFPSTKRTIVHRAGVALALVCVAVLTPARTHAQRGFGCSWNSPAEGTSTYWTDPLMHNVPYDGRMIIARIWYSGYFAFCAASAPYGDELSVGWAHDFPHPEENLAHMTNALSTVRAYNGGGNIFKFDDPELAKFPIAYLTEPGGWIPSDKEAVAARNYLLKGGFLIVDDWRGSDASPRAWAAMKAIFPTLKPIRVPDTHPIFNTFFQIKDASSLLRQGGFYGPAEYWGIFENNDPQQRLMVILNVNADVKDYWVWSAMGFYPIDTSNEAYKLGINYLMYTLTH